MNKYPVKPRLSVGQCLFTKNGTIIGNAIVVAVIIPKDNGQPILYKLETDFGNSITATYPQITELFYIHSNHMEVKHDLKTWYKDRATKIFRPKSESTIYPVYSVRAVSPALGLERRLLVCAPSKRSVARYVEAHPDYRGWVTVTGDLQKLRMRGRAFANIKYGVVAALL